MKMSILKYLVFFTFLLIGNGCIAQEISLATIANEKGAPDAMSYAELKKVFRGEKQWWADGTKIVVAFMKTSTPSGAATAKKLLGMSGDELNKYWLSLVFQGKAKAPAFFNTEKELIDFVNQNKGAIGILDRNLAGASRVLTVDSKTGF